MLRNCARIERACVDRGTLRDFDKLAVILARQKPASPAAA